MKFSETLNYQIGEPKIHNFDVVALLSSSSPEKEAKSKRRINYLVHPRKLNWKQF